jgi:Na+/H+ antiporter NhaC
MLNAERRARSTGKVSSASTPDEDEPNMEDLSPVPKAPFRWYNAAVPVFVVIFVTIFALIDTGFNSIYIELSDLNPSVINSWAELWRNMNPLLSDPTGGTFQKIGTLIGMADSYSALVYASAAGVIAAVLLTVAQKIIKLFDTMHYMVVGFKTIIPALLILTLAWSLASTTQDLRTAEFLTIALKDVLNPYIMPSVIFVLAALIAFSTGSSWSTMAILYPLAIPTTWAICISNGLDPALSLEILLNVISIVLAASVLGDHCSPISDTTILSSLASDCNHLDHVKTQLPYALLVGAVSLICSFLSTYLGGGLFISFILLMISIGALWMFVKWKGKYSTQ